MPEGEGAKEEDKRSPRARVFISCGQKKGSEEAEIAGEIATALERMGFRPYVAVERTTLKGVKESILPALAESEYFLFIDFRRERLFRDEGGEFRDSGHHRGSLFSHQELGIAAFLETEGLFFREQGVKGDDGMMKFIQANAFNFDDRRSLPGLVIGKVREHKWDPNWRNELVLERPADDFVDRGGAAGPTRLGFVRVKNLHRRKPARSCSAYLEKIERRDNGEMKSPERVEIRWTVDHSITTVIAPGMARPFDAFYVRRDKPNVVHLGEDPYSVYLGPLSEDYELEGPITCLLTFVVFSDDFSPARGTFLLRIGESPDDLEFTKV